MAIWHECPYNNVQCICFAKLTVFIELWSHRTLHFSELIPCCNIHGQITCTVTVISDHIFMPVGGYCLYELYMYSVQPGIRTEDTTSDWLITNLYMIMHLTMKNNHPQLFTIQQKRV